MIIYCRTFKDCCTIRDYLNDSLGENRYLSPHRLVDMYVSITDELVNTNILESYTKPSSTLKVCCNGKGVCNSILLEYGGGGGGGVEH